MTPNRDNTTYIVLTIVLVAFSLIGLFLYLRIPKSTLVDNSVVVDNVSPTEAPTQIFPTSAPIIPSPTNYSNDKGGSDGSAQVLTTDTFSVSYSPDRKLYQDREGSGTRYTFYLSSGNITLHVGPSWSWVHPGRVFSDDLKVAGQSTFVYKISSQTITDFQSNKTNYTLQCVHHGNSVIQSECDQFLKDFQLL